MNPQDDQKPMGGVTSVPTEPPATPPTGDAGTPAQDPMAGDTTTMAPEEPKAEEGTGTPTGTPTA